MLDAWVVVLDIVVAVVIVVVVIGVAGVLLRTAGGVAPTLWAVEVRADNVLLRSMKMLTGMRVEPRLRRRRLENLGCRSMRLALAGWIRLLRGVDEGADACRWTEALFDTQDCDV